MPTTRVSQYKNTQSLSFIMKEFFAKQRTDEIGALAVKVEVLAVSALVLYIICICLSFVLSSMYNASMVGVIFSFMGLLVTIGFIGAVRREHVLMCFYVAILAVELVLALVGTVLWLMNVVVMYTNAQVASYAIDATTYFTPVALALSIVLVILFPILVLLNIYSLSVAARLKNLLCAEKMAKLELVQQIQVREMVHALLQQELQVMKQSNIKGSSRRHRSKMPAGSASTSPILLSSSPVIRVNPVGVALQ